MAEKEPASTFWQDPVTKKVVEIGVGGVEDTRKRILAEQYGWVQVESAENPVAVSVVEPKPVQVVEPKQESAPKKASR